MCILRGAIDRASIFRRQRRRIEGTARHDTERLETRHKPRVSFVRAILVQHSHEGGKKTGGIELGHLLRRCQLESGGDVGGVGAGCEAPLSGAS